MYCTVYVIKQSIESS